MITRRKFIKTLTIALGALMVPQVALAAAKGKKYPWFDPNQQYGDFLVFTEGYFDREAVLYAKTILDENMVSFVPPKYRNRVVYIANTPSRMWPGGTLGWKTIPIKNRMPKKRFTIN